MRAQWEWRQAVDSGTEEFAATGKSHPAQPEAELQNLWEKKKFTYNFSSLLFYN